MRKLVKFKLRVFKLLSSGVIPRKATNFIAAHANSVSSFDGLEVIIAWSMGCRAIVAGIMYFSLPVVVYEVFHRPDTLQYIGQLD